MSERLTIGDWLINSIKTIFFMVVATLPTFILGVASVAATGLSMTANWVLAIIVLLITTVLIYYLFTYYQKHTAGQIQKIRWKDIGIAFGLFVVLRFAVVINVVISEWIQGSSLSSNDAALQEFGASITAFPMYLLLFNFIIAIAGPILEELAFRGIFVHIWSDSPKRIIPAITSSMIFALAHGFDDLITYSMYLTMGLIFYYAYYRRGNILDAILVHIFNNSLVVIASLFLL